MVDEHDADDPVKSATAQAKSAGERRRARSSAKAKADLEEDVEELTASLNTHKFLFCLTIVGIFDAVVFQTFDNWAAPICITALEFIGIFVLARHLEILEAIQLTYNVMRLLGRTEKDPGAGEAD